MDKCWWLSRGERPADWFMEAGAIAVEKGAINPRPARDSHYAELDDEVTGEVLLVELAPFLAPEAHQGGFVDAHDDPGVKLRLRR